MKIPSKWHSLLLLLLPICEVGCILLPFLKCANSFLLYSKFNANSFSWPVALCELATTYLSDLISDMPNTLQALWPSCCSLSETAWYDLYVFVSSELHKYPSMTLSSVWGSDKGGNTVTYHLCYQFYFFVINYGLPCSL